MKKLTVCEIKEAVQGELISGSGTGVITRVCTDSRLAGDDCIFVPIIGEVHDAHEFIPEVYKKGCRVILVSEPEAAEGLPDADIILVKNTTKAMQSLAAYYLNELGLKTVAVTGSVGKTSTRDLVYAILSEKYKTGTTAGNFNNDIGVPLTIFSFDETMQAAVLEMGMDHAGEIHRLVNMVRPDVGIITNVGVSHIENLGSRENIRAAKMEIADYFDEHNTLVLNKDNDMLKSAEIMGDYKVISAGTEPGDDYYVHDIADLGIEGISFVMTVGGKDYRAEIPVPGAHNALNAALAAAACSELGVTAGEAVNGMKNIRLTDNRLAIREKNGIKVIDDTYNAAPDSVKSAVNTLMKSGGQRKIAILGGMNELGTDSEIYHREVGAYAAQKGVDLLIAVGTKAEDIAEGAEGILPPEKILYFPTKPDFYGKMKREFKNGDIILVKASRGMKMEDIVNYIIK